MRKLFLLLLISSSFVFGQSESQIGWIAKFGAAGGFSPLILFPNFDGINNELKNLNMNELSGPITAWGGGGYAYVMILDNLRLGGMGFSGSKTETKSLSTLSNEIVYSIGGGAATIEYTFPFVKNMALSAGVMLGGGSLNIDIYQNSGNQDWNQIWEEILNESSIIDKELSLQNSFYILSPTVNLDYPITRFLAIRGGVGYQFTFGDSWEIANDKKLVNVPDNINGNGFFIQTGLFIGLFAF